MSSRCGWAIFNWNQWHDLTGDGGCKQVPGGNPYIADEEEEGDAYHAYKTNDGHNHGHNHRVRSDDVEMAKPTN
jgi:hypothetical protein